MTFPTHLQTPAHVCQLKREKTYGWQGKERFLLPAWMILMKPKSRGWCLLPLQLTIVYRTRIRKQRLDTDRLSPDYPFLKQIYIKLKSTCVGLNCYICRIQRRGNVLDQHTPRKTSLQNQNMPFPYGNTDLLWTVSIHSSWVVQVEWFCWCLLIIWIFICHRSELECWSRSWSGSVWYSPRGTYLCYHLKGFLKFSKEAFKLIKSNSKDIYNVTKEFKINAVLLNFFYPSKKSEKSITVSHKNMKPCAYMHLEIVYAH